MKNATELELKLEKIEGLLIAVLERVKRTESRVVQIAHYHNINVGTRSESDEGKTPTRNV
jgi:hypothetical protein